MPAIQLNFCPFCGNELKIMDELCPFCNRDISFFHSEHVLEMTAANLILNALDTMPRDFGRYVLASVLRGSASPVIFDNDLDRNSYYGDLGKLSKKNIINMIDSLIETGFIDTVVQEEEISIIRVSDRGMLALDGKDIAWVRLPFPLSTQLEPIFTRRQKAVMPELRSMRKNLAVANDIPPYLVFNDDTLKDLTLKLPTTIEELGKVKGIKEARAKKYAEEILETVKWALDDFDRKEDMDERAELVEPDGSTDTETSENGVVFAKIPLKRIAVSRETGEKMNICSSCGGYFPILQDVCPHCMDEEDIEETVAVFEEIEEERMVKCPYCEEDFGIDEQDGIFEMECPNCGRVGVISTSQGRMFAFPENVEFEDDEEEEEEEDDEDDEDREEDGEEDEGGEEDEEGEDFDEFEDEEGGMEDHDEDDGEVVEEYSRDEFEDEEGDTGGAEEDGTHEVSEEVDFADEFEDDEGDVEEGGEAGTDDDTEEDSTDEFEDDEGDVEEGGEAGIDDDTEEGSTDEFDDEEEDLEGTEAGETEVETVEEDSVDEFEETDRIEMLADEDPAESDDVDGGSESLGNVISAESSNVGHEDGDVETNDEGGKELEMERFELDLDEQDEYSVETSDSPSRKNDENKDKDQFKIEVDD